MMSGKGTTNNLLRQLEARIKGQPMQDTLVRQRQLYANTAQALHQHADALRAVLAQAQALRTIRGDAQLLAEPQQRRLGAVRARAREIGTLLSDPACENKKLSEKLEAVKRACTALSDEVKSNWQDLGEDYRTRGIAFRPLAQRLSPALVQRIDALERLLQGHAPPIDTAAVQAVVQARSAFQQEIDALDLDGPVESFIRDAQAGRGSPKDLLKPEIQKYLNEHPQMWNSLRVVLA